MDLIRTGGIISAVILFVFILMSWPFIVISVLIFVGAIIGFKYIVYLLEKY